MSSVCLPFLLAFLNPYAYCTTTNSLTLPMPIHPSTYFFIHTCMVLLIHFTSHYFIYQLRAALCLRISNSLCEYLALYTLLFLTHGLFSFLTKRPIICSCSYSHSLVVYAILDLFVWPRSMIFFPLLAYTFVLSRGIIRSVTSCCDINIFNNIPDRRLHCRQPHRIPKGTYDKHLVP